MTWSDVTQAPKPKVVRQFGVVCFVVFGGLGLYRALKLGHAASGWGLAGFGLVCLVLGLAAPGLFRWFFTASMVVAFPIGFVVSQVMLALLFFGAFFGVGLFLRWTGKDPLGLRRKAAGSSYWEPKTLPTDPARYLKQY